ncbi:MAG: 3-isopropylmalate dehydratase small subunit [Spirochaetaceae bacterium]|jgi:3-isopropylmalate/(R)-2-methylmalate dehydratase small subunit|nr:3-isopropylmalate dehydratase small subunit [Spirochaetaceae bacterium]
MKEFGGKVIFLDRDDINTDEIIPAKYLNEEAKSNLKPYLLEDLKLEGFSAAKLKGMGVVVTRANFGCGSSREHAPWALEANGINVVIAESFARIFRQNMFNCGMLACALSKADIDALFAEFSNRETSLSVDIAGQSLVFTSEGKTKKFAFTLEGFERNLVEAGGWVDYAAARY